MNSSRFPRGSSRPPSPFTRLSGLAFWKRLDAYRETNCGGMRSNRSRKHESTKTRKWPRWRRSLVRGGFLSSSIETPSSEPRSIDVNRYSKNKLRLYVDRRFLGLRPLQSVSHGRPDRPHRRIGPSAPRRVLERQTARLPVGGPGIGRPGVPERLRGLPPGPGSVWPLSSGGQEASGAGSRRTGWRHGGAVGRSPAGRGRSEPGGAGLGKRKFGLDLRGHSPGRRYGAGPFS